MARGAWYEDQAHERYDDRWRNYRNDEQDDVRYFRVVDIWKAYTRIDEGKGSVVRLGPGNGRANDGDDTEAVLAYAQQLTLTQLT